MKKQQTSRALKRKRLIFIWGMLAYPILQYLIFFVFVNISTLTMSFQQINYGTGKMEYFTLQNYERFFYEFAHLDEIRLSIKNSLLAGVNNLVLSFVSVLFGYFFYKKVPGSGVFGKEVVKDWKAMGFHIPMSFEFDVEKHDKSQMLEILDECEKEGLQLIIRDKRTRFRTYMKKSREEFIAGVREAYEDFGRHKGAFGFFAGDEPVRSEEQALIETIKILLEEMPGLVPFSNMFPYWSGSDFDMQTGRDSGYFKGTMEKILGESKTPMIAYDHYTQCLDDNYNQETGVNSYFYDLDSFYKVSKQYGIPFYLSALCVGHWMYRVPTEDDIRWQIYTALAHGARGIVWFHLYNVNFNGSSYRGAPFFGPEARHTEMYEYMLRQQQIFNLNYKKIFDKIEMTAVYHTAHIYDPARRFCEDEYISKVTGKHSYPTIITYYKEMDSEEKWLSVVNAHQRHANYVTVNFKNGEKLACWLAPGEMKLVKLSDYCGRS